MDHSVPKKSARKLCQVITKIVSSRKLCQENCLRQEIVSDVTYHEKIVSLCFGIQSNSDHSALVILSGKLSQILITLLQRAAKLQMRSHCSRHSASNLRSNLKICAQICREICVQNCIRSDVAHITKIALKLCKSLCRKIVSKSDPSASRILPNYITLLWDNIVKNLITR